MRILIVDDQDTMLRIIINLLHELKHNDLKTAPDGVKALKILTTDKIDLVISDWNMPNMSGYDLLRNVRATPEICNTPFIMVTAEAEKDNILAAIKADVDQYVVKPFSSKDLEEKIKLALKKRGKL